MATAEAFLHAAASEIGYTESPSGSNRTKFAKEAGHTNGAPWCASFVVAMARRVDLKLPSESAYTPTMAQAFKTQGHWHGKPKPGDLVFFDFPDATHRIQHVGIVAEVRQDGTLTTVEGNTSSGDHGSQYNGGGVYRRHRTTTYVVGYGRPDFTAPPELLMRTEVIIKIPAPTDGRQLVHTDRDGKPLGRWSATSSAQVCASAKGDITNLLVQPTRFNEALVLAVATLNGSPVPTGAEARVIIEHR